MEWYALEAVNQAVDEVKEFLLPFDWKLWTKIAIISLFLGNIGSLPTFPGFNSDMPSINTGQTQEYATISNGHQAVFERTIGVVEQQGFQKLMSNGLSAGILGSTSFLILASVVSVFMLGFLYVSSTFEFVFYQVLKDKEAKIVEQFKQYYLNGLKYFLFFSSLVLFLGLTGAFSAFLIDYSQIIGGLSLLLIAPLWLTAFLTLFFVHNLVLPEIVQNGSSFRKASEEVYNLILDQWKQAGAFLVGKTLIGILNSVLVLVSAIFLLIAISIPFGLIGLFLYIISPILAVLAGFIGLIVFGLSLLYVKVPIESFMYEYVWQVYFMLEE